MRYNGLIITMICAVMMGMCACNNEPQKEDPTFEDYTKAFIRTFGQPSASQDWRMSTNATVTVDLGARQAQNVNIATATNGRYHLVAQYINISGRINAEVYVPEGTTEVLVDIDGEQYTGTIGQSISCNGGATTSGKNIEEAYAWTWAVDGMNEKDFDFNDVVIAIRHMASNIKGGEATTDNLSVFRFIPLAAGSTQAVYINFRFKMQGDVHNVVLAPGTFDLTGNEKPKLVPEAKEYHQWFSSFQKPRMINTGVGSTININTSTMTSEVIIPQGPNLNLADCQIPLETTQINQGGSVYNKMLTQENMSIFYVTIDGTTDCENTTESTSDIINPKAKFIPISTTDICTASMFIYSETFPWRCPSEHVHILDAYPGFGEWVKDPAANQWPNNPVNQYLAPAIKVN